MSTQTMRKMLLFSSASQAPGRRRSSTTRTKLCTLTDSYHHSSTRTLSADPSRQLIGDDEHVWSPQGIFNIEGGCYAKCASLSATSQPAIHSAAIRFGSIFENVVYDPTTREPQFDDISITENTRVAYPLEFIENALIPGISANGAHPRNLILLTCDAFGILPPVSRLTPEQAVYHFLAGYTS